MVIKLNKNMEEENLTQTQKNERVFNLTVEIADMKLKKKSTNKAFSEELRRLEAEVKDLTKGNQEVLEVY